MLGKAGEEMEVTSGLPAAAPASTAAPGTVSRFSRSLVGTF